jgi:hypothetical protein
VTVAVGDAVTEGRPNLRRGAVRIVGAQLVRRFVAIAFVSGAAAVSAALVLGAVRAVATTMPDGKVVAIAAVALVVALVAATAGGVVAVFATVPLVLVGTLVTTAALAWRHPRGGALAEIHRTVVASFVAVGVAAIAVAASLTDGLTGSPWGGATVVVVAPLLRLQARATALTWWKATRAS